MHTTGTETVAGNKTLSGNTTFTGTTAVNNATTVGTAQSISTGSGLTSGQALAVSTGSSIFTTGAGTGFFYGGGSDSLTGATTFKSTGNFTGTLVALTADQTTAGTVLGISAQNLTTGKAIDVSLGTLYSGTSDAVGGYTIGAVNVRAQSFTGNVFNVSASGAGSATANLANFQSTQLAGQVLNVNATSLTTGKAVAVTLGTQGTGIYVNTAAAYSGNLIQLQMNGVDRLVVDQAGNTTLGGTLTVRGASITGPASGAFAIDNGNASAINIGGTNATTLNLGRATQTQALLGNATVAGTLGVSGATTLSSTLGVTGDTTLSGALTGPAGATFAIDSGGANAINIGGTNATALNLGRATQTQALLGNATVAGTLGVTGATTLSSTLTVTGNTTLGGTVTGPSTTFSIDTGAAAGAKDLNIGGTNAVTLNLGRTGQTQALLGNATVAGTLAVTGASTLAGNATFGGTITGPSAATFAIDAGGAQTINIGGTTATTLNLGRAGQTQALLGNATVAGTLTVGNGAGNDYIEFAAEATNPACAAATYRVWANSTDLKLKKCENGTVSDLDTTGGWQFLGTGSLGANGTNLTVNIAAKKYLEIRIRIAGYSGGGSIARLRFNGDTGTTNYSVSASDDASAPTVTVSGTASGIFVAETSITGPRSVVFQVRNVLTLAKTVIGMGMSGSESAGTAPTLNQIAGVWVNTTAQITSVTLNNGAGGNLLAGTEMTIFGRDDN